MIGKRIEIKAAPSGRTQKRLVIAMNMDNDTEVHRDSFNVNSATSRRRFVAAVAHKLDVDVANLDWLDQEITTRADEEDENAALLRESSDNDLNEDERKSSAMKLIEIAGDVELFHCPDGDAYATFRVDNHLETAPLKSTTFILWLARQLYVTHSQVAGSHAMHDAIAILEASAKFDGDEQVVHLRVAEHENKIVIDLCDSEWRVVVVDKDGWSILDKSPVKFRRSKGMLSLPTPEQGGTLGELRDSLNVADDTWPLIAGWLVASLRPGRPFPVLCLHGEQGTAKSTTAKILRSLVDPSSAPIRAEPRDERDFMIAAKNGWLIVFDNLSKIPGWLSDALCRIATGGGFSTRKLHANDEEVIFQAIRPVILTGIEELATRSDLIDRSLLVTLKPISDTSRVSEDEFWEKFEQARPRLFGALLTAVSVALRQLPNVRLESQPRMADFTKFAVAAELALDLQIPFLEALRQSQDSGNDLALETSHIARHILTLMSDRNIWEGTATDLLAELNDLCRQQVKNWPKTPRLLSGEIRRLAPNLRRKGIDVEMSRQATKRSIRLINTCAESCVTSDTSVIEPCLDGPPNDMHDTDDARTPLLSSGRCESSACDHTNPASWRRDDGKAFCPGCDKFLGRLAE